MTYYCMINMTCYLYSTCTFFLKGQSHEKVCELMIWDISCGLNYGSPTVFKIKKRDNLTNFFCGTVPLNFYSFYWHKYRTIFVYQFIFFVLFRLFLFCFGSIETPKLAVSIQNRNNRNKHLVSNSVETSFGSSFGCFESKLVS
jgi:hypothetical protein